MNPAVAGGCLVCCRTDALLRCSRCKIAIYCSKEHQKSDWKVHKRHCPKLSKSDNVLCSSDKNNSVSESNVKNAKTYVENSSKNGILCECSEKLNFESNLENIMMVSNDVPVLHTKPIFRDYPDVSLEKTPPLHSNGNGFTDKARYDDMVDNVIIGDMNAHGVCVIDNFLRNERGTLVLEEVLKLYNAGIFEDGQVVSSLAVTNTRFIRQDQIKWISREEEQKEHCKQMQHLFSRVDYVISTANKRLNNGRMGDYRIKGRTAAMVACYPGHGTHYVKHFDNPNGDGRCITAIYYLNLNWDVEKSGGLLRIYPEGSDQVANITPSFDRIVFFWSDRRNPHEVLPAFATRYAITLWYYDSRERAEYEKKVKSSSSSSNGQSSSAVALQPAE